MRLLLFALLTFTMLYPTPVAAADHADVIMDDDDGYSSYRMLLASGDQQTNRSSVITRDDNNYACYRVVYGAGTTPIPTSTDLAVNSLLVGTCSIPATTGTVNASQYGPCSLTEAVVVQSDHSTVLSVENATGEVASIDSAGKLTADGGVVAQDVFEVWDASAKRFDITTDGDDVALNFHDISGNKVVINWDDSHVAWDFGNNISMGASTGQVGALKIYGGTYVRSGAYMTAVTGYYGDTTSDPALMPKGLETAGHITNDGSGTHYIGSDGVTTNRFDWGYFKNLDVDGLVYVDTVAPKTTGDLSLKARDTFGIVLMEDSLGNDRLRTSQSGTGADIDVALEFTGGTNSGSITLDDGANRFDFDKTIYCQQSIITASNIFANSINADSVITCDDGYYGDTTSDPALMPKGMQTTDGTGISIGGTAPTTNALDFADNDGFSTVAVPTDMGRIIWDEETHYFNLYQEGTNIKANIGCGTLYSSGTYATNVYAGTLQNKANSGPPSATYWFTDGTADDATVTADTTLTTAMYMSVIDATSNTVTADLPATPAAGDMHYIFVKDLTFAVTVGRNGNTINWAASDYSMASALQGRLFVWNATESTWMVQ